MEQVRCSKCGKGVSSPVPDNTIVRAWIECPECVESASDASEESEYDMRLNCWIRSVPHTKVVPLIRELIEMLVEQEMIGVREDGVPYHAHSGDFLI